MQSGNSGKIILSWERPDKSLHHGGAFLRSCCQADIDSMEGRVEMNLCPDCALWVCSGGYSRRQRPDYPRPVGCKSASKCSGGGSADREACAGKERRQAGIPGADPGAVPRITLVQSHHADCTICRRHGASPSFRTGRFSLPRFPGRMRIFDPKGGALASVTGVTELASLAPRMSACLTWCWICNFRERSNLLTFFDFVNGTNSNTYVVRARLDEAAAALRDVKVIFQLSRRCRRKGLAEKQADALQSGLTAVCL